MANEEKFTYMYNEEFIINKNNGKYHDDNNINDAACQSENPSISSQLEMINLNLKCKSADIKMKNTNLRDCKFKWRCKTANNINYSLNDIRRYFDNFSSLQNQANLLIKELNSFLNKQGQLSDSTHDNSNTSTSSTLSNIFRACIMNFNKDGLSMKSKLCILSLKIKQLSFTIKQILATPQCIQKIKLYMEEIDTSVHAIRNSQGVEYEQLQKSEQHLWQEILTFQRRYEVWQKTEEIEITIKKYPSLPSKTRLMLREEDYYMYPDVKSFEDFLFQSRGHTGGWDFIDHNTFIRIRNKYRSDNVHIPLEEYLDSYLPVQTMEEIRIHENWYKQYLNLLRNKKDIIKKWKIEKENVKESKINKNIHKNRQNKNLAKNEIHVKEREQTKAKLTEWKLEKSRLMAIKRVEKKVEQSIREAEKVNKERNYLEIRRNVKDFLEKKNEKKREEILKGKIEKGKKEKGITANLEVHRFWVRDLKVMETQKEKQKVIQAQEEKQIQRLESFRNSVRVEGVKNPARLFQKTKGWEIREQIKSKERRDIKYGRFSAMEDPVMKLGINRLSVPAWRQNI